MAFLVGQGAQLSVHIDIFMAVFSINTVGASTAVYNFTPKDIPENLGPRLKIAMEPLQKGIVYKFITRIANFPTPAQNSSLGDPQTGSCEP